MRIYFSGEQLREHLVGDVKEIKQLKRQLKIANKIISDLLDPENDVTSYEVAVDKAFAYLDEVAEHEESHG